MVPIDSMSPSKIVVTKTSITKKRVLIGSEEPIKKTPIDPISL